LKNANESKKQVSGKKSRLNCKTPKDAESLEMQKAKQYLEM